MVKTVPTHLAPPILALIISLVAIVRAADPALRFQNFDSDPQWESHNNRVPLKTPKKVAQNFGFTDTNFAGRAKGEVGGTIWRSSTSATYADRIAPKTLNDSLSASGTFALTASSGSSGAFLGFFNSAQPEGSRQNSMGLRFAGEGSGARLTLQLVTATNQACGTKITPWVVDKTTPICAGLKVRPSSIRNDGTRYTW
jgi:hypothetical protein